MGLRVAECGHDYQDLVSVGKLERVVSSETLTRPLGKTGTVYEDSFRRKGIHSLASTLSERRRRPGIR